MMKASRVALLVYNIFSPALVIGRGLKYIMQYISKTHKNLFYKIFTKTRVGICTHSIAHALSDEPTNFFVKKFSYRLDSLIRSYHMQPSIAKGVLKKISLLKFSDNKPIKIS
jgi:hypothetical protein